MLLKDVIQRLSTYEPTEKRSSFLEDYTLSGLIDMVTILIERRPTALNEAETRDLATMILERCLFSLKFEAIDEHITPNVHLEPIERKQMNKCHAKESI
jgi:ubiquitin carboxyl-terminal hydrolase 34